MSWLRARFYANYPDSRPIKFPPPGPYWESGFTGDEKHSIVIAYLKTSDQIYEYWPEAKDVTADICDKITFSDRFPKPKWWTEP